MKTSKKIVGSSLLILAVIGMVGCGTNKNDTSASKYVGIVQAEDNEEKKEETTEEKDTVEEKDTTEEKDSTVKEDSEVMTEETTTKSDDTEIPMVELPEGITGMKAEKTVNKQLRDLIIEYMEIPEDFFETTKYYYNYVDLNEDGEDEIFVVVSGPYTSGTGGSSALWVVESAGKLHVNQDFTLVNTPVIVSDTITNGVHELVVPYYGGGAESQYSILTCSDGAFTKVADGRMVKTLEGITGKAIIANDILAEVQTGIFGFSLLDE